MNFNFEWSAVQQGAGDKHVTLFASIDGRAAQLGGDEVVFYDPLSDSSHVMTAQVLQALDVCRRFLPLDQHAQQVCATVPGLQGQQVAVRRVLEGLAARGLLVSGDAFLQRFSVAKPEALAPVRGLFIRACDRPAQLRRLLLTLQAHASRFGLPAPVIVLDDSRSRDAAREHADLVRQFAEASGQSARYVGAEQWGGWVDSICAQVGGEALRALLSRPPRYTGRSGGGIGKNLISLLAAGGRYLLLDDDFTLPLHAHPERVPGLAWDGSAWAVRTFGDRAEALSAGTALEQDALQQHLRYCGQGVAELIRNDADLRLDPAALRGMAPSLGAHVTPDARITATLNGHRGNSGASGIAWMYLLDRAGWSGLVADLERYPQLRGDPPVWWGCRQFQLTSGGAFTPFAVDASRPTPPTSPFGRGEDALYSALMRLMHRDAVQLDMPWAIGHEQEAGRDRSELLGAPETPDLNHALAELARDISPELKAASASARLAGFAHRLEDLALASDHDLVGYLREFLVHRRSTLVEQLQRVAEIAKDAPKPWREDVNKLIEANGRAVVERAPPRFAGWPAESTASACASAFREEATTLVNGIRVWGDAWECARQRAEAGGLGLA